MNANDFINTVAAMREAQRQWYIDHLRTTNDLKRKPMKVTQENNKIFIEGKQVANFSMKMLQSNGIYELDNGQRKWIIALTSHGVAHFRNKCFEGGLFFFRGTNAHLRAIQGMLYLIHIKML